MHTGTPLAHALDARFAKSVIMLRLATHTNYVPMFSSPAFSTPANLVPRFPVLRFPPLRFGPTFSSPAFSTPAIWSHVFQSCVFQSRVFSRPARLPKQKNRSTYVKVMSEGKVRTSLRHSVVMLHQDYDETTPHTVYPCFALMCSATTRRAFKVAPPLPTSLSGSSTVSSITLSSISPLSRRISISAKHH